jgi:hypothetical protein
VSAAIFDRNLGLDRKREDEALKAGESLQLFEALCGRFHRDVVPGAAREVQLFQLRQVSDAVQLHRPDQSLGQIDRVEGKVGGRKMGDVGDMGGISMDDNAPSHVNHPFGGGAIGIGAKAERCGQHSQ